MTFRTQRKLIILLFFLFPLTLKSVAQEKVYLTMEEAISRALIKNNQVRASEFALKRASWNQKNAWTLLLPTLNLSSRFMRIDDRTFAERDFRRYLPPELSDQIPQTVFQESYYTAFDVTLPVFNGAILNGLSIANANKRMASQMNKSTRDNIVFQVISSYLNVMRSKDILELQNDYLELSRLNYEKAERLHTAGRYSKTEALRWKVDLQQQKSVVVNSESTLRSARTILGRLLNIDQKANMEIETKIPQNLLNESESLAAFSDEKILSMIDLSEDELIKANDALAAAKSNEEISKSLYRNSYVSYLPNVSLSYTHAWRENNTIELDDYSPKTLMVNLSMPVFTSFQNATSTKAAYYEYKQSQENFLDQLQNTKLILTETANKLINSKTQRELSKTNVEFNENNYRIVSQQKEKGLISNIDFIDAKLNLQNARLNDISTQYELISAMVELYYLLGKLDTIIK